MDVNELMDEESDEDEDAADDDGDPEEELREWQAKNGLSGVTKTTNVIDTLPKQYGKDQ